MLLNCEKDLDNADEIDLDNVVEKWAKQVNNMPDVWARCDYGLSLTIVVLRDIIVRLK